MNNDSEHIGILAAAAAAVIWGFLGIFVRGCSDIGITPVQMTCLRYMIVIIALAAYIFIFHRGYLKIDGRTFGIFLIMGIVGIMLNSTFYFQSMVMISISLSTVLQYLAPFIVIVLSIPILHERISKRKIMAVLTAFLGCILCTGFISDPGGQDIIGIALGALSGFCFATYTLCSKKVADTSNATTVLFYTGLICFIGLAPICDMPSALNIMFGDVSNLLLIVGLGLGMTLLPFWLFNFALERVEAGKTSIVTFIEPMTATALGFAVFGEDLTVEAMIGIAMILVALIIVNRKEPSGKTS